MKAAIFHATAGHGHKKVAEVIGEAFIRQGSASKDIHVLDALEHASGYFKVSYPAIYYYSVKYAPGLWGWFYETLDHPGPYTLLRGFRSAANRMAGGAILEWVAREKPDVLICTHFFTAELFATARRKGLLQAPLVTVVTDFLPHTFWVNDGTDYYWVMGEDGRQDLLRRGVEDRRIVAGGIPVSPAFLPQNTRGAVRRRWNLEENRLTLLLTSGSFGLGHQEAVLHELERFSDHVQALVVCGNNTALKKSLEQKKFSFPVCIFGFVDFMADLMEASDLVLSKAGGSTTTESLAKGVPLIITDCIPGQETRNARILLARGAAFTISEPSEIRVLVQTLLDQPAILEDKKREIQKIARPNAAEDLVSFVRDRVLKNEVKS